jgi:hypothetical protein
MVNTQKWFSSLQGLGLCGLSERTILLTCKCDFSYALYRSAKYPIAWASTIDGKIISRSAKCHIVS